MSLRLVSIIGSVNSFTKEANYEQFSLKTDSVDFERSVDLMESGHISRPGGQK